MTPELPVEMNPAPPSEPAAPESSTPTPALKRNVLGTMQIVNLWQWCERNRDNLAVTPNPKLAAIAQAELEFPVTAANIANMLDELHIQKRKPDAPPTVEEQVMRLADAWRKMDERVSRLEAAQMIRIDVPVTHPELGLPVPGFGDVSPARPEHFPAPSSESHFPGDVARDSQ